MALIKMLPEDVQYLAVHCSATSPAADIGAKEIDRWHRDRGWLMIGYHFVIRRNGHAEEGRPIDTPGAHVEGYNHCSIGICMVGGVDADGQPENNFTDDQFAELAVLLISLKAKFPKAVIQGHRDFPHVAKACPSFDVRAWWKETVDGHHTD